jgi:hypothetical protein
MVVVVVVVEEYNCISEAIENLPESPASNM